MVIVLTVAKEEELPLLSSPLIHTGSSYCPSRTHSGCVQDHRVIRVAEVLYSENKIILKDKLYFEAHMAIVQETSPFRLRTHIHTWDSATCNRLGSETLRPITPQQSCVCVWVCVCMHVHVHVCIHEAISWYISFPL